MGAIVFDCDGVLADTERDGHRIAFNQMFGEFGLPVCWTEEGYGPYLRIGGGKERLRSLLTPDFIRAAGLPESPAALDDLVRQWHERKTAIYISLVEQGRLPARPGVRRLVREALSSGWKLAVASTSARASVAAVLRHAVGEELAGHFAIVGGEDVRLKKPDPEVYTMALKAIGVRPPHAVAIEDSRIGLLSATAAELPVVITVSAYTVDEAFGEARLVVSSLGDPKGPKAERLAGRRELLPGDWVTLADLDRCRLEAPAR